MYCASSLKESANCSSKNAVFIVESDKVVRSNLRERIKRANKFRLAGEMPYLENITDELAQVSPNIVIFSSFIGSDEQYSHIKKVHNEFPLIKKVVLAKNVDEAEFCSSVVAGVKGYCSINSEISELIKAIERQVKNESREHWETLRYYRKVPVFPAHTFRPILQI